MLIHPTSEVERARLPNYNEEKIDCVYSPSQCKCFKANYDTKISNKRGMSR